MKIEVTVYLKSDKDTPKTPLLIKDADTFRLSPDNFLCIGKNSVSINVPREEILSLNINTYDYESEEKDEEYFNENCHINCVYYDKLYSDTHDQGCPRVKCDYTPSRTSR